MQEELSAKAESGRIPLFGGADKLKWRRQVVPGETLDLRVDFTRIGSRGGRGAGRATVDGEVACQAELMVVLVEAERD